MHEPFRLLILYRTYAGENSKGRPPYYSKRLAAASLVRAVERLRERGGEVEVVVLQDGAVESAAVPPLRESGASVRAVENGTGLRASWVSAVRLAVAEHADRSAVYFVEDDYLHSVDSLVVLRDLLQAQPHVDFVSLYDHPDEYGPDGALVGQLMAGPESMARGSISTCHTFAARASVLADPRDRQLLLTCVEGKGAFDHWMWMALLGGPVARAFFAVSRRGVPPRYLRRLVRLPRAEVRRRQRREGATLAMPVPGVATHLESRFLGHGRNWTAEAEAVQEWLDARGAAEPDALSRA
jgi:hypothetical protein